MEEDNNKVISLDKFKGRLKGDIAEFSEEVAKDAERNYRSNFAEVVAVDIVHNAMLHMGTAGVNNVNEDTDAKDVILIIEAVKSLILKGQDIYHPFQDLAEEVLALTDDEENEEEGK